MSTDPNTLSVDATSLVAAQANQLASSKIMVAQLNENLKVIYLGAFNNWKGNVEAGRIPNTDPPKPPKAYVVSKPDAYGFQWPVLGTDPVCDMPPIPEDRLTPRPKAPDNNIDVGHHISGAWFSVGPDDTFPSGMTTPPIPDATGALHTYQKFGAPVGPGWYLRVS